MTSDHAAYMRGYRAGKAGRRAAEIGHDYRQGHVSGRQRFVASLATKQAIEKHRVERDALILRKKLTLAYREGYRDGFVDAASKKQMSK